MPFGTAIARAAQAIITFIMISDRLTQSLFVPVYLATTFLHAIGL
ncbi:hypothetical protein COO91_10837 (plasmid) [Nostoc flagelliforme CCNUN1]|uniref:Uncharacterized protein n=1 Tax=Nostoc flagelliforme CCNUN1 TaxID=2038116 RepID=A0A2K8TAB8_9NOSO|nr:hypothetical protein [Nostoc flagelliforme]AUB44599.1 hypothetical protein COO91_10837 [Nostoc flagelliforme CCNUN1]